MVNRIEKIEQNIVEFDKAFNEQNDRNKKLKEEIKHCENVLRDQKNMNKELEV